VRYSLQEGRISSKAFVVYSIISVALVMAVLFSAPGPVLSKDEPKLKDITKKTEEKTETTETEKPKVVKVAGPADEFGRGNPRDSVKGYFKAAREGDHERAAHYLDLRNLPRQVKKIGGPELARKLKIILDRSLWVDMSLVSDSPGGHSEDGLPKYRDVLGVIETEGGTFNILLQKVPREDGVSIWKFSNVTVAQIPELYEYLGYGHLGEALYSIFPDVEFLGARLWQWIGIVIIMIVAALIALLLTWITSYILRLRKTDASLRAASFVEGPVRFLLWALIVNKSIDLVSPTVTMRAIAQSHVILTIAVTWIIMRVMDFLIDGYRDRVRESGRSGAVVLLKPLRNVIRIVIGIAAALVVLDNIGFKVTTIIAGLGVGSLAVALAAQKTLEDMIGAITLYTSQPVRIGDFGRFGDTLGTIEDIGMRLTRVRTLDNTLVNISNAEFAKLKIENFTKREKIWYHPRISLTYGTTQDQIRTIITEVEKLLRAHPKVLPDIARVRFEELGDYSLNLNVFTYIDTTDFSEYLEIAEELNFQIMDAVEKAGASFAFPSQTMYLEAGSEASDILSRKADEREAKGQE
jgi:MscS family membrane protein